MKLVSTWPVRDQMGHPVLWLSEQRVHNCPSQPTNLLIMQRHSETGNYPCPCPGRLLFLSTWGMMRIDDLRCSLWCDFYSCSLEIGKPQIGCKPHFTKKWALLSVTCESGRSSDVLYFHGRKQRVQYLYSISALRHRGGRKWENGIIQIWVKQRELSAWGIQTGLFCSPWRKFCSPNFQTFSPSFWGPILITPNCARGIQSRPFVAYEAHFVL